MNKISVIGLDKKFKKFEAEIRGVALKILEILNKDGVEAEIYLIDGPKMRFLNKKFRGKDKITTVLSFEEPKSFICPPPAGGLKYKKIGEIYLKLPITNYQLPITKLLIHSLIHLFGYDHQKKNDRIKMEKKEEYVHNRLRLRNISN